MGDHILSFNSMTGLGCYGHPCTCKLNEYAMYIHHATIIIQQWDLLFSSIQSNTTFARNILSIVGCAAKMKMDMKTGDLRAILQFGMMKDCSITMGFNKRCKTDKLEIHSKYFHVIVYTSIDKRFKFTTFWRSTFKWECLTCHICQYISQYMCIVYYM